ncbi:doubled CXXCH domain-containing protein [Malonomonas rubra DSM 5091]|uniref:Doubled CXXCH domain-containing protein n=1 Tax=Malonomonas rubra DSM 5091 TaxID=1122189 RepID=A0A1M6B3Y9_MALRU|nr:hypothetical protein [Malonomonas rubra]SHI43328.1 doubled CXXCH domain-containing protein [Malonomonas rubra DSM 5091]
MMKYNGMVKCRSLVLAVTVLLACAGSLFAADVYQQQVPEMTTLECAKCHVQVFEALRDAGGLHQQECRDCHDKFHTFTPGVAWEDRVPSCASCHEHPHGEELIKCLDCHQNAHAPIESLVVADALAEMCGQCHQGETEQLQQNVSAHTEMACAECHQGEKHGARPACTLCHEKPHTEYVDNAGCASCHPPHAPLVIKYDNKVQSSICAGCHPDQRKFQESSDLKHRTLACVVCHADEHGNIHDCQHCHGYGPHNPELLKNFKGCVDCHGDPHSLNL